jgi:hypothetical protein
MQEYASYKAVAGISKEKVFQSSAKTANFNGNLVNDARIAYVTPEAEHHFRECLLACHVSRRVYTPRL